MFHKIKLQEHSAFLSICDGWWWRLRCRSSSLIRSSELISCSNWCVTGDCCDCVVSVVWAGGNKTRIDVKDCSLLILATTCPHQPDSCRNHRIATQCLFGDCLDLINFARIFLLLCSKWAMIHKGCLLDYDADYQCEVMKSYLIMQDSYLILSGYRIEWCWFSD